MTFWNKLGFVGKFLVVFGVILGVVYGLSLAGYDVRNLLGGRKVAVGSVPEKQDLPQLGETQAPMPAPVTVALPASTRARAARVQMRGEFWWWNAQLALLLANGGSATTEGSLFAKHGISMSLIRNDDTNNLRDKMVQCANQMALNRSDDCSDGIHFMAIMGDQAEGFFTNVNHILRRLDNGRGDYELEIVALLGRSHGEDAWWGPKEWQTNPQRARGKGVVVVVKEGDWNIVVYKSAQDRIPINPDVRTINKNMVNFIHAPTYTEAAVLFNKNYCEERPVVDDAGRRTGERARLCSDSLSTWFPADKTAVSGRGGIVRLWSTRENQAQMPNVLIGIKKWNKAHAPDVDNMIDAIHQAGEMIKRDDKALRRASEISAQVNCATVTCSAEERDWKFTYDGYKGFPVTDRQGNEVEVGGSMVFNLADALYFLGVDPWGRRDLFKDSYTIFGNWLAQYYPEDFDPDKDGKMNRIPYESVMNKTYLLNVVKRTPVTVTPTITRFRPSDEITGTRAQRAWSINFETGKATLTPAGERELETMVQQVSQAVGTLIEIHGHTDDVGDSESNFELSMNRARTVKRWLMDKDPINFRDERIRVQGFGESRPLVDAKTPQARAQNRRVEIVLGAVR